MDQKWKNQPEGMHGFDQNAFIFWDKAITCIIHKK